MIYESVADNVWEAQELQIINLTEELIEKKRIIEELEGKLADKEYELRAANLKICDLQEAAKYLL